MLNIGGHKRLTFGEFILKMREKKPLKVDVVFNAVNVFDFFLSLYTYGLHKEQQRVNDVSITSCTFDQKIEKNYLTEIDDIMEMHFMEMHINLNNGDLRVTGCC